MAESTSGSTTLKYGDVYKAAVDGKEDIILNFHMQNPASPINDNGDTVLHVLALYSHTKIASKLLELQMHHGLSAKNCKGNTALHEAARVGALEIAMLMVNKEQNIVNDTNFMGETPLYWAAAYGKIKMFHFLAKITNIEMGLRRNDGSTILHASVMGDFYGLALKIMGQYPYGAIAGCRDRNTALHLLGQLPISFRSGTFYSEKNVADSSFIPWALLKLIIYFCIPLNANKENLTDPEDPRTTEDERSFLQGKRKKPGMMRQLFRRIPVVGGIVDKKQQHELALELVKLLIKRESEYSEWNNSIGPPTEQPNFLHSTNTITDTLVLAARNGIVEIVDVILKECPWAIEFVDENGKNILHFAAEYRQTGIFKLLKSRGILINKMASDVDNEGNTALHLAAKHPQKTSYATGYDMAWELLWFKRVKDVSPAHMSSLRNSEGRTAYEIFDETHQNLLRNSVEWAKLMSSTFMVVSTLIATVNFSAAFAVPGGYDQVSGVPVFSSKSIDIKAFYAYSTVALVFSVASLGSSFSAFLSRFHSIDFYFFLPFKYLLGGCSLFYSVFYTVFAYIQALILVTNGRASNSEFLLGFFATAVAILSVNLEFIDIMFPVFRYMTDLVIHKYFTKANGYK
ncbi:uncharacterized protein LOC122081567 [Macadamia integrifolia]|uniref:uncharacterized protein LOC122081567 n=1 Tax=Macadamia integrifolia TaxID=60698 RepID=UPI001C4F7DF3|nr:uncharacterized protein LOC122081567 [Macadamia integrifolia]